MRHPGTVSRRCVGMFLAITGGLALIDAVAAADQPPGETESPSSFYTYHDDWAIVSAPPPPGPYQSVNIDPRIPGQEDVITPFVSGFNEPPAMSEQLPDDFKGAPPAAGTPSPAAPDAYPRQEFIGHEPPPGYYRSRGYSQNRPAPIQDYSGPYGYPRSGNSRYGYTPSPWSNPPLQRPEDEVLPPPVYNRMAVPPPPVYRSGPAPDQYYRRGTGTQ
ncbi:MAG: hypothetical protein WCH04_04665 [Gammaproteobacteria bacterium]